MKSDIQIHSTENYSQFVHLSGNRSVDRSHVERIKKAINKKNLLPVQPILVTKKKEIIDGQHRLEAAKQLKTPIYFFYADTLDSNDIINLNNIKKGWTTRDYINFYVVKKTPGYDVLNKFINEYPQFPVSTMLVILSSDGAKNSRGLKEGIIDVGFKDHAHKLIKIIIEISDFFVNYNIPRPLVMAIRKMSHISVYNHKKMMDNLQRSRHKIEVQINEKEYEKVLWSIHNRS